MIWTCNRWKREMTRMRRRKTRRGKVMVSDPVCVCVCASVCVCVCARARVCDVLVMYSADEQPSYAKDQTEESLQELAEKAKRYGKEVSCGVCVCVCVCVFAPTMTESCCCRRRKRVSLRKETATPAHWRTAGWNQRLSGTEHHSLVGTN